MKRLAIVMGIVLLCGPSYAQSIYGPQSPPTISIKQAIKMGILCGGMTPKEANQAMGGLPTIDKEAYYWVVVSGKDTDGNEVKKIWACTFEDGIITHHIWNPSKVGEPEPKPKPQPKPSPKPRPRPRRGNSSQGVY